MLINKIYNTKVNRNACETTLLLSSAVCTLCSHVPKQIFTRNFSVSFNCRKTGNMRTRTETAIRVFKRLI